MKVEKRKEKVDIYILKKQRNSGKEGEEARKRRRGRERKKKKREREVRSGRKESLRSRVHIPARHQPADPSPASLTCRAGLGCPFRDIGHWADILACGLVPRARAQLVGRFPELELSLWVGPESQGLACGQVHRARDLGLQVGPQEGPQLVAVLPHNVQGP